MLIRLLEVDVCDEEEINTGEAMTKDEIQELGLLHPLVSRAPTLQSCHGHEDKMPSK